MKKKQFKAFVNVTKNLITVLLVSTLTKMTKLE